MRKVININSRWKFIKTNVGVKVAETFSGEMINLPHTWTNVKQVDIKCEIIL